VAAELVHRRVRSELREVASGWWTVSTIARAFQDEGFAPAGDERAPRPADPESWNDPGQRRGTFDQHAASIDWTDAEHVRRALGVFETLLQPVEDADFRARVEAVLDRHGLEVTERGRLRPRGPQMLADLPLHALSDSGALEEHLDRLRAAALDDPPLAVSLDGMLKGASYPGGSAGSGEPLPVLVRPNGKMNVSGQATVGSRVTL